MENAAARPWLVVAPRAILPEGTSGFSWHLQPYGQWPDLAAFEPWRQRAAAVLAELPDDMADYKGIIAYRDRAVAWLRNAG